MKSYVWVTFALLGVGYYELSGGAGFQPGTQGLDIFAEVAPIAPADLPVTRLAVIDMTSVAQSDNARPAPDQVALDAAVLTVPDRTDAPIDASADHNQRITRSFAADETEAAAGQATSRSALRLVNASRVNLRNGPGEDFGVVAKLGSGTPVQVLKDPGNGWVQLRTLRQGRIGWVADFLLDDA